MDHHVPDRQEHSANGNPGVSKLCEPLLMYSPATLSVLYREPNPIFTLKHSLHNFASDQPTKILFLNEFLKMKKPQSDVTLFKPTTDTICNLCITGSKLTH